MNSAPLFSIIIPTFNSAVTIGRCLTSVASQSFRNFEVLIMDGLSSDETLIIAKEFGSQLPLFVFSQKDEGIYDAMNKGIASARGNFLYFLGSDDALFNNSVLQQIAEMIAKSTEKVIHGNVRMIGKNDPTKDETIYGGPFDLRRLLNSNLPHQGIFYHRSVFEKVGNYNIFYPLFADYDLNLRAMAMFHFRYIAIIVANFALGGASTMLKDEDFERDKVGNFIRYYLRKIHTKPFVEVRYYLRKAASNDTRNLSPLVKAYCLFVYCKLKLQSLYN